MADMLANYVPVAERLARFYLEHPDGRIATTAPAVVELADRVYLSVTATVYRSADDPTPCVATAWEPWPGRTAFTRDSEAMNAETSAVGRALGLAGLESTRSIATREEVAARAPGPGLPVAEGKGRVLAAAHGDQVSARRAWSAVVPADLSTVPIELVEAAENVAQLLADNPADEPAPDVHASGLAAARAVLEEGSDD